MIKFNRLHERLFVRGHTRHAKAVTVLKALQENNIGYVLNVSFHPDKSLAQICKVYKICYRHEPLVDSQRQPMNVTKVMTLINSVAIVLAGNKGVLVHCDLGHNRSNLIAISALSKYTGKATKELIKEARVAQPKTLKNSKFEAFVLGLKW